MDHDLTVLVCGGRNQSDYAKVKRSLDQLARPACIVHGAARGADSLADLWAQENRIPVKKFPALWNKHGRAAGPIRNQQMLEEAKPDLVVAFPDPESRGTKDMVHRAEKAGVDVVVVQ